MMPEGLAENPAHQNEISGRPVPRSALFKLRAFAAPRLPSMVLRVAVLVGFFGLWELLTVTGIADAFFFGMPSSIAASLVAYLQGTNSFWVHLQTTLQEALFGLASGAIGGFLMGMLISYSETLRKAVDPIIYAIWAVPRIALAPLLVLWFGTGPESKIALAFSVVFFIMLLNTHKGIVTVDHDLVDAVRLMGASRRFVFRTVTIPAMVPWLVTGFRLSCTYALMCAVVGEMIASRLGIGRMLLDNQYVYDVNGIFALLFVISLTAVLIDGLTRMAEDHFSQWRITGDTSAE